MGTVISWPDDMIADLKRFHAAGDSFSKIATKLTQTYKREITRSAAIGKAKRLGLSARTSEGSAAGRRCASVKRKKKAKAPATAQQWNQSASPRSPLQALLASDPVEVIDEPNADGSRPQLADLTENQCRWPKGDPRDADFHFCDRPKVPGAPYCEAHARKAFVVPPPRQRRSSVKSVKELVHDV